MKRFEPTAASRDCYMRRDNGGDWCQYETTKELAEALAPFAGLLQSHNDQGPDKQPIFGINDTTITLGDLRKAVAALKKAGVEL